MPRSSNLSLRNFFSVLFGFQLVLIVGLGILILILYQNQTNLAKSRDTSLNSFLLADELHQSSDDLTRMARAYVATGNPEFEREYWAILDIRNGKIPRPVNYNRIYWDFVAATGQKPRPDGEAVSLRDLMAREGFTTDEFDKLVLAQKNSDGLVKAETIAMNAMKGLFDDGSGNFTVEKEPDPKMANDLMNNEDYYRIKAEIMKPIDEFYVMFEERTGASVAKYLRLSQILFWAAIALIFLIMGIFLYSFIAIRRQIVQREKAENQLSDLNRDLEQRVSERTAILEKSEAKTKKTMVEMEQLNKFMVGRELRMKELKDEIEKLKKDKK